MQGPRVTKVHGTTRYSLARPPRLAFWWMDGWRERAEDFTTDCRLVDGNLVQLVKFWLCLMRQREKERRGREASEREREKVEPNFTLCSSCSWNGCFAELHQLMCAKRTVLSLSLSTSPVGFCFPLANFFLYNHSNITATGARVKAVTITLTLVTKFGGASSSRLLTCTLFIKLFPLPSKCSTLMSTSSTHFTAHRWRGLQEQVHEEQGCISPNASK